MSKSNLSCLVIGGAGFLGSHLVNELVTHGWSPTSIAVFDLEIVPDVEQINGISYFTGDITNEGELFETFSKVS